MLSGNGGCTTESLTVAIWGREQGRGTRAVPVGCGDLCRSQPSADVGWEGWSALCNGDLCRVGTVVPVIPEHGDQGVVLFTF